MKTHRTIYSLGIAAFLLLVASCGGSSSSDSALQDELQTRTLSGSVPTASSPSASSKVATLASADDCLADTVIATDTEAQTVESEVGLDCGFTMELELGKAYTIGLVSGGAFVATVLFDSGITGFSGTALPVGDGEGVIDLGVITISGTVAIPENEPLEAMDEDGDGIDDLLDDDDDSDDIADADEVDCDLDGIIDDLDLDSTCDDDDDVDMAKVLEVKPRNDPQPEHGNDTVDLDKDIKARTSCVIDQSTVTAETFRVEPDSGEAIACVYDFSGRGTGSIIKCKHDDDPFLADTLYTVILDGVLCDDATPVAVRSWSFMTEDEDSGEGNVEDEIDDENEAEEDSEEESNDDQGEEDDDSDESDDEDDEDDDSNED